MSIHPFILVAAMAVCSVVGGLSFRAFAETRDVLMLVAGFAVYALSNVAFILVMDQTGLTRAMVVAATAQMILTAFAAYFLFGERLGVAGWISIMLACLAVIASTLDARSKPVISQPKSIEIFQETDHV